MMPRMRRLESSSMPSRKATSMPSFMMSTLWSESLSRTSMSGYLSWKSGMPEAISRRPRPSGAVTRDGAARLAGQRADGGLGLGDRLQHLLGAGVEHRAVLGRHQLPGRAVEQPHAEMLFQLLDAVGGDRRRDAHVAARRRQIAEFDDADEDGDVVEIGHAAPATLSGVRKMQR